MARITEVSITNIKGIASLSFQAGAVTVLAGSNGVGKTSVIDAIAAIFDGGHDPSLLRNGTEKGEVLITLDDGSTIRKRVTPTKSDLEVRNPQGGIVKRPAEYVKSLAQSFAFDPIGLVNAPKKERAKWLLEAMPIQFEAAEVSKAIDRPQLKPVSLDELDAIRAGFYADRTNVNRDLERAVAVITDLKATVPDGDGADVKAELEQAQDALAQLRSELESGKAQLDSQRDAQRSEAKATYEQRLREIEEDYSAALEASTKQVQADINEATMRVTELRGKAEQESKATATRLAIEQRQKEQKTLGAQSLELDRKLKAIDDLKKRKLSTLPIPGVDVRDGEVFVDGVPWEQVNTARQYEVAIALGAMKAGELALMVVDRAESFDEEAWELFQGAVKESGLQVIAARVTDGPLAVTAA